VTLEDDLSVWGKIIGAILGAVALIGTLLSVGREWTGMKWRVKNLEGQMEDTKTALLRMHEQANENTRQAMEATQQVALYAERLEGNSKLMVEAMNSIKAKVDRLEQHQ